MSRNRDFQTVHTEGGLLQADQLSRIALSDADGVTPADYDLPPGEKVNEVISQCWARLCKHWADFQETRASLPESQPGTDITNQKWLLPLFRELGYGKLTTSKAPEIDGKTYPITRFHGHLPIHFVGCNIALDKRSPGVKGAATGTPHGLVQEFLNRSDEHLWAFVSNGRLFRILRDNVALSRQSYVEFDLEAMFDGEVYSDFALLWMVCHVTRTEGKRPELCWLEKWSISAREHGTRVLEDLRTGVEKAIEALGRGFVSHPSNDKLRQKLRDGRLGTLELYHQVLRTVYRLLFLFVAEDRDLLHPPDTPDTARGIYVQHYSTRRLRELAGQIKGSRHSDLWHVLSMAFAAVSGNDSAENIRTHLGLPVLGSRLWRMQETPDIIGPGSNVTNPVQLSNDDLLCAIRHLAYIQREHTLQHVNYRDLGSEELGSVYESLLELQPDIHPEARRFKLRTVTGSERKTTGSYYTPDTLVQFLLDSTLDPVIDERLKGAATSEGKQKALLGLRVCDPACGSGHFLIAAAHRIARHLSRVRAIATGDAEPTPITYKHALRDVIGRCIYGVDINPLAVELCKVSLWMEALEPGKPLSFLDHRILCGNSLVGATPALIKEGIPDEAFKPIEGDDKEFCKEFKKKNKREREGQRGLFNPEGRGWQEIGNCHVIMNHVDTIEDSTPEGIRQKEKQFRQCLSSEGFQHAKLLADVWCAAFMWERKEHKDLREPITYDLLKELELNPHVLPKPMHREVDRLAAEYGFFHWHLAFPDVFSIPHKDEPPDNESAGWSGGFDCVLGNPPWDKLTPDSKEFFSKYDENVRFSNRASERAIVDELLKDEIIESEWASHRRKRFCEVSFIKESRFYKMFAPGNLGKGDLNTYRFFVELALITVAPNGFAAQVAPEGLYNGANSAAIRKALFESFDLKLLYGFVNSREIWFDGIDSRAKFCIYSARRAGKTDAFRAAFNISSPEELIQVKLSKFLSIPVPLVTNFSPGSLSLLEFRGQKDIDISLRMYELHPKLGDESFGEPLHSQSREIDMTNDAELFCEDSAGVPLYEGRMIDHYDHRAKGYVSGRARAAVWEHLSFGTAEKSIRPQWRIMSNQIPDKNHNRINRYRIGYGWVASPTNERSFISALIPPNTTSGNSVPTIMYPLEFEWMYILWLATANSFTMDFLVRMKVSLNLTFTLLKSLPFPRMKEPNELVRLLAPHVLALTCTSKEMNEFWISMADQGLIANVDLSNDAVGANDPIRRLVLRSFVDAIVAHDVFCIQRDEVSYIMDTFPIVEEKDTAKFGEFLTKRLILLAFDGLDKSIEHEKIIDNLLICIKTLELEHEESR